jgi:hypothetical protein
MKALFAKLHNAVTASFLMIFGIMFAIPVRLFIALSMLGQRGDVAWAPGLIG